VINKADNTFLDNYMSKVMALISGIGWGTFSTLAVTGFQLVFMTVMARLLDPANFGLVAIANVGLRFFSYFAQMGTAPALIQKPKLEDGDIAAAMTVSIGISSLFFLLVQITAPLIEDFFQMPELSSVIRVLSINFIIGGLSVVSVGLLRRNTAFRAIAIIDTISYVISYGAVGLGAAYHGMGVWALVAAFMTQATMTAALSYAVIRHRLSFRHSAIQRRHFLSYGSRYSFIGFLEFLTSNLDSLVIGKLLGATPAGFYNRALLLANLPVQQPANILTKALFPIMSSIGDQYDKQIMSVQLSILLVGSYAFAASAGIYVAAADIVNVLLGSKWLYAIPILQMLSLSVGPTYISHVAGVTLDSMNKLRMKLQIQLVKLFILITLLLLIAPAASALNIAAAVVATEWAHFLIMSIKLTRLLRISFKEVILIILCVAAIAITTASAIWLTLELIGTNYTIIKLIAEIFAGASGLILGFFVARYLAVQLHAVRFLIQHAPLVAKIFPKFT